MWLFGGSAQLVLLGDFNAHHKEWLFPYQETDHPGRETYELAMPLHLTHDPAGPRSQGFLMSLVPQQTDLNS